MTYSSTLDGAITADTTDVFVDDAPTAPYPPFVQVGSELMAVVSVQPMAQYPVLPGSRVHIAVQRGALGTTRATHSDAAAIYAVTPVVQTSAPSAPPAAEVGSGGGGTLTEPLTVTTTGTSDPPLILTTDEVVWTVGNDGMVEIDGLHSGGFPGITILNEEANTASYRYVVLSMNPGLEIRSSQVLIQARTANGARTTLKVSNVTGEGFVWSFDTPDDAALLAGQCSFAFDDTDGAAKLLIKGKSANGTVVAGEVALS